MPKGLILTEVKRQPGDICFLKVAESATAPLRTTFFRNGTGSQQVSPVVPWKGNRHSRVIPSRLSVFGAQATSFEDARPRPTCVCVWSARA